MFKANFRIKNFISLVILTALLLLASAQFTKSLTIDFVHNRTTHSTDTVFKDLKEESLPNIEELEKATKELEKELQLAEEQFQENNYLASERRLREIIKILVDPDFPLLDSASESVVEKYQERICESTGAGFVRANGKATEYGGLISGTVVCRTVESERTVERENDDSSQEGFLDDKLFSILEKNVERGHRIGSKSLALLQQVLIAKSDGSENNKVLEISELGREFEYGRISPLLQISAFNIESIAPVRIAIDQIVDIAKGQKSTIVYL